MKKVVIKDMVAEVSDDIFFGGIIDITFDEGYLIRIADNKEEGWFVANAMNGYGRNCKKSFENEKVTTI